MKKFSALLLFCLIFSLSCSYDVGGLDGVALNNSNNINNSNNSNNVVNNTNNPLTCGNGTVETGEECDQSQLNGATCVSLGLQGSGLSCDDSCHYDTSACDPVDTCGNGTVEPDEECDGAQLNGNSCESLGFTGSGLACDGSCQFDLSACDPPDTCGNGTLDGGEECDGSDLGGATCATFDYYGTGLTCNTDCTYDLTQCVTNGTCGDGVRDTPFEQCDGADVGSNDCESLGVGVGPVACNPDCTLDLNSCADAEDCADHMDNDGDGDVDCADSDCAADLWCVNTYSTEVESGNERVEIGSLAQVTGGGPVTAFSVSYWVKLNGYQPDWATPMGASSSSSWTDGFGFYHSSANLIKFWIDNYGDNVAQTNVAVSNNVWYHVVGTYDMTLVSQNIKIYLNGTLSGSADYKAQVSSDDHPITIGTLYSDDMVGFIDEVAFWPLALSAQNVAAIYNSGSPFNLTYNRGAYNQALSLSAYYRMGDQDALPTVTDRRGSNHGSVLGGNGDEFVTDTP